MVTTSRTVFITGGSKGIGKATAARLLAAGHKVAATYRSGEVPDGVLGIKCDVLAEDEIRAAIAKTTAEFGPVEAVIANAGITRDGLAARMSDQDWEQVLDTNLTGAFRVARAAIPAMLKAQFGRIIFISSVVATLGTPGQANYAASKAGLIGLARSLARELAGKSITSNVVAPGFVETDMTASLDQKLKANYKNLIPLNRFGLADEVAASCEFLISDDAAYITGAVIPVDGGLGMGH
ncbi:MAG: beta-ketoacyl-ACP reductase [Actinomycetales bacterium]|nr:MAG: beta-ketoacyl-ACP reductase [Actinomycetales bacterium]